ncbi:hypothetical protein MANI_029743 [Metarhizium anisopliae]|nr:hypothetical protein MANI_029743 [Metarhizium anisopliae]
MSAAKHGFGSEPECRIKTGGGHAHLGELKEEALQLNNVHEITAHQNLLSYLQTGPRHRSSLLMEKPRPANECHISIKEDKRSYRFHSAAAEDVMGLVIFHQDIIENDLDGTEDFTNALSTPDSIYGDDRAVLWCNCEASILSVGTDGKLAGVVKSMTKTRGWCVVPRGYALYCVGTGGHLKKA